MQLRGSGNKKRRIIILLMLMGCLSLSLIIFSINNVSSQTLDQSQLVYNGGMSARTLAGYSEWQSFTAGLNGTLCEIHMGFFNYINGSGTLKIFSGFGTGGTLLQSKTVTVFCPAGNCMITFLVFAPSVAGQVYTFQFIPGAGIPDPYGVQVQVPGTYSGGQMAIVDPSGTYPLSFDMVFQTYVNTNPLPVEYITFTGENKTNMNELHWVTASETNNDYFDIERSAGGNQFEKIGRVKGGGNSSQNLSYDFDDEHPLNGINYYRLKQVDFNGEFKHSNVITIHNKSAGEGGCIYSEGNGYFIFRCNEFQNGKLLIYDMYGKLIEEKQINSVSEEIKINLSSHADGIYFACFFNEREKRSIKILKNKLKR